MIPGNLLSKGSPILFVLLWSTGFIGAKLGIPHAEPMTFLSLRFLIAICFLLPLVWWYHAPWPSNLSDWLHAGIVGFLVHGGYLGGVFVAIKGGLPAALAALIVGLQSANWDSRWASAGRDVHKKEMDWTFLGISWGLDGCIGKTTRRKFLWDGFNLFRQPSTSLHHIGHTLSKPFCDQARYPDWCCYSVYL
ncbi:MAG: EamA family transporter, partial [SAR324 cluster bacterium]|nr:EamA family transporter [SAR324 cluster bacterium]